jgi:hypothetical protein
MPSVAVETHQENRFLLFEPTVRLFEVSLLSASEFHVRRLPASELAVVADFFKLVNGLPLHRIKVAPGSAASWWRAMVAGQDMASDQAESAPAAGLITGPAAVSGDAIPEELAADLRRIGVHDDVQKVLHTVSEIYPDAERVELSLCREETGDVRVHINATVAATGDEETERYFRCLGRWTAAVSPEAAKKIIFTTA